MYPDSMLPRIEVVEETTGDKEEELIDKEQDEDVNDVS